MTKSRKDWIRYFGSPVAYDAAGVALSPDQRLSVKSSPNGRSLKQTLTAGEMIAAAMTFTPPVSYQLIQ